MANQTPARSRLCNWCNKVCFDIKRLENRYKSWNLGTVGRIRQSECRLCRFISFLLYDEATMEQEDPSEANTELALRWSSDNHFKLGMRAVEIYFLKNLVTDFSMHDAFHLVPNASRTINIERVKRWIDICNQTHSRRCRKLTFMAPYTQHIQQSYPELRILRFIDVQKLCVVETMTTHPYLALSYVWGLTDSLRLTTFNKEILMQQGALQEYWLRIPRTIRDALKLTQEIGQAYLWCDILCLVQNDPDDVDRGVKTMDLIYEYAELTIIAACGHDANAGLPGVHEGTRLGPRISEEIIPGLRLGGFIPLSTRMRYSVYNSRAWTLQEHLLSSRCLVFIDNLIYFECSSSTMFEHFHPELDMDQNYVTRDPSSLLAGVVTIDKPFDLFQAIIEHYVGRSLTNQEDILAAMGGIIQRLSRKMKCQFLEGLPTSTFDFSVLFRHDDQPLYRRHGFPSYSWTGWKGRLGWSPYAYHDTLNRWLCSYTWIIWYWRNPRGIISLVWDILANEDFPYNDDSYEGYRQRRPFRCSEVLPFSTGRTQPTEDLGHSISAVKYSVLQFWTLSGVFNIQIQDIMRGEALILDDLGTACGGLLIDDQEGWASSGSAELVELIAVSEFDGIIMYMAIPESISDLLPKVITNPVALRWYNVLVLMWQDGIAERRGIGWITQAAFLATSLPPGLSWKEIILG
ncbi:HET-domain-containing protein [Nemania sp. FL0916]|nr:HET-domain-containing protein [Nemania sp. FL0916]